MDEFEKTSGLGNEGVSAGGRPRPFRTGESQSEEDVFATLTDPLPDAVFESPLPEDADPVGPDRKYSFNALIAVGIAGFVVGRLLSR